MKSITFYLNRYSLLIIIHFLALAIQAQSDSLPKISIPRDSVPKGVSVSPSSIRFAIKPGSSQSKKLNIINDTDFERSFEVKSQDYNSEDINRSAADSKTEENYKYGLSKWTYITPSVFTLKPGERMSVNVLVDIPPDNEHNHAAWSMIIVEEVKERQQLDVNPNAQAVALGVIPTMGFGIFVYQNPPGLKATEIGLTSYNISEDRKNFSFKAKNLGEGIGFCTYYFEVMNMATGKIVKIPPSQATFLPGAERQFKVDLPTLPSGSYNAMIVLDYGSKEMVETAEIDFGVK